MSNHRRWIDLGKTLVILEVSRKQDYIFTSKQLRENARRSAIISYVTDSVFFECAAGDLYTKADNLVYTGGGHTVLQFDSPEQARRFAQRVTSKAMVDFDGLELFVKQMPYVPERSPGDNLKKLSRVLERKKALRRASFQTTTFGVEVREAAEDRNDVDESQSVHLVQAPVPYQFPREFQELAGEDNFIAVVHIDGNAMGKRVDRVYADAGNDWEACRAKLQRFSAAIQQDFESAFSQTVEEVIHRKNIESKMLPIRPVILAGDDVCFVTAGSLGLECARIFLEKLAALYNQEDGTPYAACAGVALVHVKYPFHQAYRLSEELCSNAKVFGAKLDAAGRVCAMDWHIEFGQMKDNLSDIRQEYRTEDNKALSLRPVAVIVPEDGAEQPALRTYEFFRELCRSMKGEYGKTARGKIKDLRTAFKQGEVESRFFFQDKEIQQLLYHGFGAAYQGDARWEQYRKILLEGESIDKEPFRALTIAGETDCYCLYFDAIEMIDHFELLEEV